MIGILAGLAIAGFLIYDGIASVVKHKYCLVMSDDFSSGFNTSVWTKEQEVGGYGYVIAYCFMRCISDESLETASSNRLPALMKTFSSKTESS